MHDHIRLLLKRRNINKMCIIWCQSFQSALKTVRMAGSILKGQHQKTGIWPDSLSMGRTGYFNRHQPQ